MGEAAQRVAVAIVLQKTPPGRGCLRRIDIELRRQLGIARLQRRVDQVAGHHRVVAVTAEGDRDVARCVPGGRHQADMIADPEVLADNIRLLRLDHRQHAVAERRDWGFRILPGPVVELAFRENVAGIGKSRHPASVVEPGVPADMIDMQVGTHHEIDILQAQARRIQRAHVGVVGLHVPLVAAGARLVVADAGIHQDGVMRRAHDIGLECEDEHVVGIDGAGLLQPWPVPGQRLRRQARQHVERGQERGFLLDDAMDGEVADVQRGHVRRLLVRLAAPRLSPMAAPASCR